jgi:hypothetical protein
MLIGAEVLAPDGFHQLSKGRVYRFVGNVRQSHCVVLAFLNWIPTKQPESIVFTMAREVFEDGLSRKKIVVTKRRSDLPPWLAALEGIDLETLDTERKSAKKSYRQYAESRLLSIQPALANLDEILSAEDVAYAINHCARNCSPKQNETRFRARVLTYLCFGRNMWSLLPPYNRNGGWDRNTLERQKQGRKSEAHGNEYGFRMTREMSELSVKGYLKYNKPGRAMTDIYSETMTKLFGCKTTTNSQGDKEFYHPQGKPFPTIRQYRYAVEKAVGIETIQINRWGKTRYRRVLAPSKGRFSEDVAYLLEKVEFDGYFTKERPRGYLEGSTLPSLCVVVARDMLSGAKLGIGFSFGAERMTAYRMTRFCMAVPKDYFCRLWGIELKADTWVTEGLSPHDTTDRGVGSSEKVTTSESARPPVQNMTPAYAGQSKATVESSHPRNVIFEGEPHYIASNLTPVELAKREIYELIRYNHTADMSARMPMDRELSFVLPTPHELWKHYASKLRTAGISMSISDAVRTFLTPVRMTAKTDGVYLDGRKYDSKELRECGLLNRIARRPHHVMQVQGFILDLCIRHVWIEVDHKILLLNAILPIRADDDLLNVSIAELAQWNEARAVTNSRFRDHVPAANAEVHEQFEANTGKSWYSGTRKPGRAKKTAASRQETSEVNQHTSRRRPTL